MVTTMFKSLIATAALILTTGPIAAATPLLPRLVYLKYQDGTQLSINCSTQQAGIADHPPVRFSGRSVAAEICRVSVLDIPEAI